MSLLLAVTAATGVVETTGNSAGISTVTGISATRVLVTADSSGVSTVTGISAAFALAAANAAGIATVAGIGAALTTSVGNATGTSIVDGVPVTGGTPVESDANAVGTSAVDGITEVFALTSSGIHRLRNAQSVRPYPSIDWQQGFEPQTESQAAVPVTAEIDHELELLLRVAVDKEIAAEQATEPSISLLPIEPKENVRRKHNEALILLLMAA